MSIEIVEKKDCCGCSACSSVCPEDCIQMERDEEGFLYPKVDHAICVECGKCEKACHIINPVETHNVPVAYAAMNGCEEIRMQSSSGGVFSLLAEYIIDRGGVVFGAVFDDDFKVKHKGITSRSEIEKIRGSKYVQSEIGDCYRRAKEYLEDGRYVLFTGTPCQIDGLLSFLNKPYEKLYTQDLICHGAPSQKAWAKYLKLRETEALSKTQKMSFRYKKNGWQRYFVQLQFENGTKYEQLYSKDLFMRGFLFDLYLRPACYNCHSKTLKRRSDITLADFWGIQQVAPEMFDDKGTSLIFINSGKGKEIFEAVYKNTTYKKVDVEEAVKYNHSAIRCAKENKNRSKFFNDIDKMSFDCLIEKYAKKPRFLKRAIVAIVLRAKTIAGKILKGN